MNGKPHLSPALRFEDLSIATAGHPPQIVLTGINWSLERGSCGLVSGPPGSGKTDLLSTLAALRAPAGGRCWVLDRPRHDPDLAYSWDSRVAMVFSAGGRLLHHLDLLENVALPLAYHDGLREPEWRPRVELLLEFTGLSAHAARLPGLLPVPIQQRAALARSLARGPELLLLDDPLAGLPRAESAWWQWAVRQLGEGCAATQGRPLTLLIASEAEEAWGSFARRRAILQGGGWRTADAENSSPCTE